MADYNFYTGTYLGNSITAEDFPRIAARAQAQLEQYERSYCVTGTTEQKDKAVCAMADALYYYEAAANGGVVTSCSVGSVSSGVASAALPDMSPRAQSAELYRCAKQYLSIYRGVG
ncbi:MAG: hypothetical protein RSF82_11900 [Angelakisella sp.]